VRWRRIGKGERRGETNFGSILKNDKITGKLQIVKLLYLPLTKKHVNIKDVSKDVSKWQEGGQYLRVQVHVVVLGDNGHALHVGHQLSVAYHHSFWETVPFETLFVSQ